MKTILIVCSSYTFLGNANKCMMGYVHYWPLVTKYKICSAEKGEHMKDFFFVLLVSDRKTILMKQHEAEPLQQNTFIPQGQNQGDLNTV